MPSAHYGNIWYAKGIWSSSLIQKLFKTVAPIFQGIYLSSAFVIMVKGLAFTVEMGAMLKTDSIGTNLLVAFKLYKKAYKKGSGQISWRLISWFGCPKNYPQTISWVEKTQVCYCFSQCVQGKTEFNLIQWNIYWNRSCTASKGEKHFIVTY